MLVDWLLKCYTYSESYGVMTSRVCIALKCIHVVRCYDRRLYSQSYVDIYLEVVHVCEDICINYLQ